MIGDPQHLAFEVNWQSSPPQDARGLGWGELVLWFAGTRVWTAGDAKRPVAWTWIDLVDHLARAWGHLLYEEVFPFGLAAQGPEDLREPRLLGGVSGRTAIEVEDAVHAFQHRHDLAAGLRGIRLPPVWLVREGTQMRLRARGRDLWSPLEEVTKTLEQFVADVKAHLAAPAARARAALDRWDARKPKDDLVVRLRTGLSTEQLVQWVPPGTNDPWVWWGIHDRASGRRSPSGGQPARARRASGRVSLDRTAHHAWLTEQDTPVMAVARLSQSLADDTRRALVHVIADVARAETPALDELTTAAAAVLDAVIDMRPFEQGYALAQWLRTKLAITDGVDPAVFLQQWGVLVQSLPPLEEALDAVACWGGRGPAVLVNPKGRHASSQLGRAATLAHEIAHLIIDRGRHLPLAEVFGGATPLHLEQRARAFAAELLLPRELAGTAVAVSASLKEAADHLQKTYGVSFEVIGWQIKNGSGWALLAESDRKQVTRWLRSWAHPRPARVRITPERKR
jgi:hypothetical protein